MDKSLPENRIILPHEALEREVRHSKTSTVQIRGLKPNRWSAALEGNARHFPRKALAYFWARRQLAHTGGTILEVDETGQAVRAERVHRGNVAKEMLSGSASEHATRAVRASATKDVGTFITVAGLAALLAASALRIGYYLTFDVGLAEAGIFGYQLLLPAAMIGAIVLWVGALGALYYRAGRSADEGIQFMMVVLVGTLLAAILLRYMRSVDVFDSIVGSAGPTVITSLFLATIVAGMSYMVRGVVGSLASESSEDRTEILLLISLSFLLVWPLRAGSMPMWLAMPLSGMALLQLFAMPRNLRVDAEGEVEPIRRQGSLRIGLLVIYMAVAALPLAHMFENSEQIDSWLRTNGLWLSAAGMAALSLLLYFPRALLWLNRGRGAVMPVAIAIASSLIVVATFGMANFGLVLASETQHLKPGKYGTDRNDRLGFAELYLGMRVRWVCVYSLDPDADPLTPAPVQLLPTAGDRFITWDPLSGTRRWPTDGIVLTALVGGSKCEAVLPDAVARQT